MLQFDDMHTLYIVYVSHLGLLLLCSMLFMTMTAVQLQKTALSPQCPNTLDGVGARRVGGRRGEGFENKGAQGLGHLLACPACRRLTTHRFPKSTETVTLLAKTKWH